MMLVPAVLLSLASAPQVIDPYLAKDGAAEAASDVKEGKPTLLYRQKVNASSPVERLPGIIGCAVGRYRIDTTFGSPPFATRDIPEADWSEGVIYTANELSRQQSALSFAAAYNRAMFRARRVEICRYCPSAKKEP